MRWARVVALDIEIAIYMWCLQFEGIKGSETVAAIIARARWGMRNETDETTVRYIYTVLFSPIRRRRHPHEPQEDRRANQLPVA